MSRSHVAAFALALLVAITVAPACRQVVGIHDEPQPHGDADAGAALDATNPACAASADACRTCLGATCCKEIAACELAANCKHSFDCILGCAATDESCRSACVQGFDATLGAALACRAKSCGVDCGVSCGGIFGVSYPDLAAASPSCAACAADKVCGELTACASEAACVVYASCAQRSCGWYDRACVTACKFPVGPSTAGDAVVTALQGRCAAECRLGTDWDCAGKRPWPQGSLGGDITASFRIIQSFTGTPLAGVSIRTCLVGDPDCSIEVDHATTDASGYVRVKAKLTGQGRFNGYVELSGGAVYPSLGFIEPPLVGSLVGDERYAPFFTQVLTKTAFALGTSSAPVVIDATRGHVAAVALDCLQSAATGVTVDVTPSDGASTFYFVNNLANADATSTDKSGSAAVLNVRPGQVVVNVRLASTKQLVAQSTVYVRPATVTSVLLAPLPL